MSELRVPIRGLAPTARESVRVEVNLPQDKTVWPALFTQVVWANQASWRWMHVPANGDWWSVSACFTVKSVAITVWSGVGLTHAEAQALHAELEAGDTRNLPPFPHAYQGSAA